MKIFNNLFASKGEQHLKSSLISDETIKSVGLSDAEINNAVHYMYHGSSPTNVLFVKWSEEGMKMRLTEEDENRKSVEALTGAIASHIKAHGGKEESEGANTVFSFPTHKDLMDCLLSMKRTFNWLSFSDRLEHVYKVPVAQFVSVMKMDHHIEVSNVTDFNYY